MLMAIDAVHEGALPTTSWQGVLRSHSAQLSRWSSRRVRAESAGDWDMVELLGTGLHLAVKFHDLQLATLSILQMLLWLQLV